MMLFMNTKHKSFSLVLVFTILLTSCSKQVQTPTQVPIPTDQPIQLEGEDSLLLSMEENGYAHLLLYSLDGQSRMRLTSGNWSDIQPSLSPDETQVAFASNRSGSWDIYILVLATGEVRQVTNTPEYDGAPTWSPDNQWLGFETYDGSDLEIAAVQLSTLETPPLILTDDPAADSSPAWSPDGRRIAFVSNRSGDLDVWLADLDRADSGRYTNLSKSPGTSENHPMWSGDLLLWTSRAQGVDFAGVYTWDAKQPERPARWITDGDWAAWDSTHENLAIILNGANEEYLSLSAPDGRLLLPPRILPGRVRGILQVKMDLPDLPESYKAASAMTPPPLWSPKVTQMAEGSVERWLLMNLPNVQAPYPQLHDQADEAFAALRYRVIQETGWDAMASLENAFVPLTSQLDPGMGNDWLYTGRAFALNPLLANAGWMVSVREDVGQQTYWRIYLRAQAQDGSQGQPLSEAPWDLGARYRLDPEAYDQGGSYIQIPAGYWVDFTSLARAFGWERLPALPSWRVYYGGTRFTEFVLTGGLDWYSAMLEIYPPEAMVTPTPRLPPTLTPSRTPVPTLTRGPSPTPTITYTPSLTPIPPATATPIPTVTPIPSNTPLP
jgi:TolB protein